MRLKITKKYEKGLDRREKRGTIRSKVKESQKLIFPKLEFPKGVDFMSNPSYTQKSMETIQLAQRIAQERGHQQLEQAHILSALLNLPEGLIPQLLAKMSVDADALRQGAEAILQKLPQVRGLSREEGKVYISSDMDKAMRAAGDEAGRM